MDLNTASILIALISLVTSLTTHNKTISSTKKLNDVNLESKIFHDLLNEVLVKGIPEGRRKMAILDDKLVDEGDLSLELSKLKKNMLYYQYRNYKNYKEIIDIKDEIEDYLANSLNKQIVGKEVTVFWEELDQKIQKLYDSLFRIYLDGNKTSKWPFRII